jgi:urease accessory protein
MGERVEQGRLLDRWRVRRSGRLGYAESLRLEGAIADTLRARAVAKEGIAVATVLAVPGDDALAERVRALSEEFRGEVGVSAWNGIAVARFCAPDGACLRHDLMRVLTALRGRALPRLWMN